MNVACGAEAHGESELGILHHKNVADHRHHLWGHSDAVVDDVAAPGGGAADDVGVGGVVHDVDAAAHGALPNNAACPHLILVAA